MNKWEYLTIAQKRDLKLGMTLSHSFSNWNPTVDLNKLGQDGWELVSVVPVSNHQGEIGGLTHELHYFLKRTSS